VSSETVPVPSETVPVPSDIGARDRVATGSATEAAFPGARDHDPAALRATRRWRRYGAVFLVYLGFSLGDLFDRNGPAGIAVGCALLALFVLLYFITPMHALGGPRARRWASPAMFAVFAAYALVGGHASLILLVYVGVAVVATHPLRVALPVVVGLCAVAIVLPEVVSSWDERGVQWAIPATIALVAVVVHGSRRNGENQAALLQARSEVERLAAEQERLRIGRDLHDLLGHALTTVTVKAQLAERLVAVDPDQAAAEMAAVAELARTSLADVRATVAGYREVSLVTELATAREVLRAAGMDAELPASVEAVPGERRELFGWIVREGVTNAVRHSRARRVTVRVVDDGIEVVDDGVGSTAGAGNGLRGLDERVTSAGGVLTAGAHENGGWRLAARW
jgi:two-component system sensor histidine kinase DesK